MSIETAKLRLLAHSKNMLNSAVERDWDRFSQLDSSWQQQLESAVAKYGTQLDSIGSALLEDNQKIQDCILKAQQDLSVEFNKNVHATSSVKKYLK